MEQELMVAFGSNIATMAGALGIYVLYRRLTRSTCAIHSGCLECESPELEEQKRQDTVMRALRRFRVESLKDDHFGQQARDEGAREQRRKRSRQHHEDSSEPSQLSRSDVRIRVRSPSETSKDGGLRGSRV